MRIISLALLIFIFSCQKSGNGYVRGTVTESGSGAPIEGVPIYVIQEKKEAKGQSTYFYDTIAHSVTSPDGTYKINYHKSRGWQYKNYVAAGLLKNYTQGNYKVDLVYKKSAINFSLY